MNKSFSKLALAALLWGLPLFGAYAQCDRDGIEDARKNFERGAFDRVIHDLTPCTAPERPNDDYKVQALMLLAETYLAKDDYAAAGQNCSELLKISPNFNPNLISGASPRFVEMVRLLKQIGSNRQVTSVSKTTESLFEAPATVNLVTQEQVFKSGYGDFEQIMHDLPGFDISRSNGNLYSHIYQRGYRSINTNRTLFLVDGVEDNDLWSSNVYLSRQFPMSNLKSVEVVFGPASTMYGSNAFLGVINIITKQPEEFIEEGKLFGATGQVGYGSYNTRFLDATFAAKAREAPISFSITTRLFETDEADFSHLELHDFEPPGFDSVRSDYLRSLTLSDRNEVAGFLLGHPTSHAYYQVFGDSLIVPTEAGLRRAYDLDKSFFDPIEYSDHAESFAVNAKLQIDDFTLGFYHWYKTEAPGVQYSDIDYLGADQGQSWAPVHQFLYLRYERELIPNVLSISNLTQFKTHDFHRDNRIVRFRNYRYSTGRAYGLAELMEDMAPRQDSTYLFQKSSQLRNEFKIFLVPNNWFSLVAGIENRFSSVQGDYLISLQNDAEQNGFPGTEIAGGNVLFSTDLGLYSQARFNYGDLLSLTLGLRYDNNRIRDNQGYGNVFNPRLALVATPGDFIFKAIYSEAFKDATNREKFSTVAGKRELPNPNLQPEKVKNAELSVARQWMGGQLYTDLSGYLSYYSNIIQEVYVDSLRTNQNQPVGRQRVTGLMGNALLDMGKLELYANYTHTRPFQLDPVNERGVPLVSEGGDTLRQLRVADIAAHQINIGAYYDVIPRLNVHLRMNFVGEKPTGENTTAPKNKFTFDPYAVFFATATYQLPHFSLQLTLNNLFNNTYFSPGLNEASGYPEVSALPQNGFNAHLRAGFKF